MFAFENRLREPTPGQNPGILIVDDEIFVRKTLAAALGERGFRAWAAESGRAALEIYQAQASEIHAVLTDVNMPDGDGPFLLDALRRRRAVVPVCFMTGQSAGYRREDLMELGAACVLRKPFNLDDLLETLWRVIRSSLEPRLDQEGAN
jgi:DNA-binding NtrC family response regulator